MLFLPYSQDQPRTRWISLRVIILLYCCMPPNTITSPASISRANANCGGIRNGHNPPLLLLDDPKDELIVIYSFQQQRF